ncbi:MAG: FkbM family methyltransferase [Verrucomicrobiota bacterium]
MPAVSSAVLKRWARKMLACMPAGLARGVRRAYYLALVRRVREDQWLPAAGVRHLLRPGQRVVDVGANIGHVTYFLSQCVGESGRVYSLEPVPDTFDILRHNVRKLGLRNVELFNCAASSSEGSAQMGIPEYEDGGRNYYESHVLKQGQPVAGAVTVEVRLRTLDSLLGTEPGPIGFIKVDAEGHELDVLLGAQGTVRRDRPAILVEVAGDPDAPGAAAGKLFELMEREGYRPHLVVGDRVEPRKPGQRAVDYLFLAAPR